MRKRFMNLSKRCMVAIMSAAFIMSSVTVSMAFPVGVYAENNSTNNVTIYHDIEVNTGTGVILYEGKTIEANEGTVTTNNGTVRNNVDGATVTTNNGNVTNNMGTVTTNNVTVTNNLAGATVTDNFGTVTENRGTVVNNFDGQVTNYNNGTVTNQYWRAELDLNEDDADKVGVTYGNDITTKTVGDINRHYIKDGQSGTITLTPAGGFEINGNTGEELNGTDSETNTAFTYSAGKDANGVWTITILNMPGSLYLNPESLNLMIQVITGEENPKANIVVPSGESSGDDGDQNPSDETNNNIVTPANPTLDKNNTALKISPNAKELSISFGSQTNLTLQDIKTLCETRPDLAKRCYFTDNGVVYELYIPANVVGTDAYNNGIVTLANENGQFGGYKFLAKAFAEAGFECNEVYKISDLTTNRGNNAQTQGQMQAANTTQNMDTVAIAAGNNAVISLDYKNHIMMTDMTTIPAQNYLTDTLARFQRNGMETVVIKVANGSFTVAMDDLVQMVGTAFSFTMKVSGDTLSIYVNGSEVATLVMS